MMNEILNCIKLIKMYAWEKSFAKAISGMCIIVADGSQCLDLMSTLIYTR